jgi:TRAP transporter TAXI family solute receptor
MSLFSVIIRHVPIARLLFLSGLLFTTGVDAGIDNTRVVLGTATKGGGFQLFGKNLAEVITTSNLQVDAISTRGSKQNLLMLAAGNIDIGLVEGNAARQALQGIGQPLLNLKVLSVMYPNPGMFVVRADSPYRTIHDLLGKPIAFGTRASGLRILVNDVLDGLNLDPEKDFQQIILAKAADGPRLVLEKQAEALWGAGIGWPGFVRVANSRAGARFIAPSEAQIKQILGKHSHLRRMAIPAGTYQGQDRRIDSIGLWSLILVRPGLLEEVVYQLARAIHQGETEMAKRLKQGEYTTAKNTVAQVPAERLHPGAMRYFKEVGLME